MSQKSMIGSPAITLILVSALFAVISQTLQVVLSNRKHMRKTQKEMKAKNERLKELMKQGEKADKGEIENVQKEMMELTTQSMKNMPKMMVANIIVFLPLFALVSHAYSGVKFDLTAPLSFIWKQGDWYWVYVLCSFLISIFTNKVLTWYEEKKEKEHEQHSTHNPTPTQQETKN